MAHPLGMGDIHLEAALQLAHGGVAGVGLAVVACGLDAVFEVEDDALAQGAAGRAHDLDVEVLRQRVEDGQATAEHGLALGLEAGQRQVFGAARGDALLDAPAQAFGRDAAVGDAVGGQDLRHRAHRAGRPQGLLPLLAREERERLLQLGACRDLGGAEVLGRVAAFGEVLQREADAAHGERLGVVRRAAHAQDHFGGAPADVDDQARQLAGLQARDALVDQAGFFAAGDDLDGQAQHAVATLQEGVAVARFAQGLGGHGAHLPGREALEALCEAGQTGQAALGGLFGELAPAVQAGAQAHGFLEVVDALVAAAGDLGDFQAEAVGAHVDGGQQFGESALVHAPLQRSGRVLDRGGAQRCVHAAIVPALTGQSVTDIT